MACRSYWNGIRDHEIGNSIELEKRRMEFRGKKIAILGERDGVPAPTIEQAIENLGAEVVYATTQCFV
jgi:hypothetical protein